MREVDRTFAPNEKITDTPANGQFIYIDKAPGMVRVSVNTQAGKRIYELHERGQVIVPEGEEFTKFDVHNVSDVAGEIIILAGYGTYVPSNDYQRVVIDSADLTVDNMLINFDGTQPVSVENTVSTQVTNTVSTQVTNTVSTQVTNTVNIEASSQLPVEIKNSEPLNVKKVSATNTYTPVGDGQFTVNSGVLDVVASETRSSIFIQSDSSNSHAIMVNGFIKLEPGGHFIGDAMGASFTITSNWTGQLVNIGERIESF